LEDTGLDLSIVPRKAGLLMEAIIGVQNSRFGEHPGKSLKDVVLVFFFYKIVP
jgi:hypothetical protein